MRSDLFYCYKKKVQSIIDIISSSPHNFRFKYTQTYDDSTNSEEYTFKYQLNLNVNVYLDFCHKLLNKHN